MRCNTTRKAAEKQTPHTSFHIGKFFPTRGVDSKREARVALATPATSATPITLRNFLQVHATARRHLDVTKMRAHVSPWVTRGCERNAALRRSLSVVCSCCFPASAQCSRLVFDLLHHQKTTRDYRRSMSVTTRYLCIKNTDVSALAFRDFYVPRIKMLGKLGV